jgi:undecaprenyl-diphosphatase
VIAAALQADHAIAAWVNGWQGVPVVDSFFLLVTELGTLWFGLLPVLVIFLLRNYRRGRKLIVPATIGALSGVLNGAAKVYFIRARPPQVVPGIKVLGPMLWGQSFPSGHTLLAFIVLGALWHLDRRLGFVWLPCAILVGLSRVYLGVHFPSDVLAGAILGFVPVYFLSRLVQGREGP